MNEWTCGWAVMWLWLIEQKADKCGISRITDRVFGRTDDPRTRLAPPGDLTSPTDEPLCSPHHGHHHMIMERTWPRRPGIVVLKFRRVLVASSDSEEGL